MSEANIEQPANLESLHREKARLRKIGLVILLVGLCSAGLVYWIGKSREDPALAQYRETEARAETRQMEQLYGTSGDVMQKLLTGMRRPRNQALTIVFATVLFSAGCFYLGRPLPDIDKTC